MRFVQVSRLRAMGFGLAVLMTIGLTMQLLGFHFPKMTSQSSTIHPLSSIPPSLPPTCQPKRHIVFLKTHKTAGSTVLNLLHRYGDNNGLFFALPIKYQFHYPHFFNYYQVKGINSPNRTQYNILCHHMRFNLPEVRKVMPADSFYFTILRDPATMAESSFIYFRFASSAFKKAPNLTAFISNPSYYYQEKEQSDHYARNLLSFDLGFDHNAPFTVTLARARAQTVEETFKLVLLTEHFDESMVLLKEELCWDLDDVVTFKLNIRGSSRPLEPEEVKKLRAWNTLDWYLYEYFNQTFWDKVERFGKEKMDNEVMRLRERRQQLAELCLQNLEPVRAEDIKEDAFKPYQNGQAKILGWAVRKDLDPQIRSLCIQMATPELQYIDLLDARQFPAGSKM
ncbi:galactose-3-O-sulfotransferase 4-like [Rana temporaria]|uniref:galactose-3-O-sulfotransferase 4-like n=1 Tax=Rana temporaria TaxID=8407 RepID=UPI001AADB7C5|nr:galactose-3-O-sulfotransferase 4-like [Rana temporaria]XP_040202679.1 galactose-3-O-sulfotransferase 4-like [Rana temporaria]